MPGSVKHIEDKKARKIDTIAMIIVYYLAFS